MILGVVLALLHAQASAATMKPPVQPPEVKLASERCVSLAEPPDARVAPPRFIAPGQAPELTFRLYEGKLHHRYADTDLMMDDAGH